MLTLLGGMISHSVFSFEKTQPCDNPIIVVFYSDESILCFYKKIFLKKNWGVRGMRSP